MAERLESHYGSTADEDAGDQDDIDETGYKAVKDAVLFAIDVSKSMMVPTESPDSGKQQDSATIAALKCAYALMQQRIISNPKDMMGILLFGTEQSKMQTDPSEKTGGLQYPHCYLLSDLDIPCASDIKHVRGLIENEKERAALLCPAKEQVTMANVFFCANQIFTTRAPNFSSRRLFVVTDNDNPHSESKALMSSAIVRAKDLYDLGVIIELFPISQPDSSFDRTKFYDDVVYRPHPTDPDAPAPSVTVTKTLDGKDGISLLQSLLTSINAKAVPKRALFSNMPLELGSDLNISVKGYIILKRQIPAKSCFIWLDGETPQIAFGRTARVIDDAAQDIGKVEVHKAFKFGGELVSFTNDELSKIRHLGDPTIRVIGFKPLSLLPAWARFRPATFVYPSEEGYVGSTRTFSAFQQSLIKKKKMAVAWYIARKSASPVLSAMIPGLEGHGSSGEQTMPPGIWILPLPFADDIRSNPEIPRLVRSPDRLTDIMNKVVEQLQLPKGIFDINKYPNPSLQWHYRILQAMALEEELPEKPEDKTTPRYRQIDKRAGDLVSQWGEKLEEEYKKWQQENVTGSWIDKKRAKPSDNGPSGMEESKKRKTSTMKGSSLLDDSDGTISDDVMRQHFNKNNVAQLTVSILKEWLGSKSLSWANNAKKADLVDQVEEYFERKDALVHR